MSNDLSPNDRTVLDRLLTSLARRLDGAIDMWTVVCLGSLPTDRRGFLLHYGGVVQAFVAVTEAVTAEIPRARDEQVSHRLEAIAAGCRAFQNAFLTLECFRTLPLEEVRETTEKVATLYNQIREEIRQLGNHLGISLTYWEGRIPEREEYHQKILRGLFDQFRHELGVQPATASSTA